MGRPADTTDPAAVGTEAPDDAPSDAGVLDRLVREHTAAAYRVALSIVRDPALAEDVVQDSLIKAWRALDTFRGEGSERGWLLRITHNTAVSFLRRSREDAHDPAKLPDTETVGPAGVVADRLAVDEVFDAMGDLDPQSRAMIVLREVEGMSYDEIAEVLEVSLPAVKTRLMRARRRLATQLEGWRP